MKKLDQQKQEIKDRKARPLSTVFIRKMTAAYILFAVVISGAHLFTEYRNARSQIMKNLESLAETVDPGAVSAIWDYQPYLLQSLVNGFGANSTVIFVEIRDDNSGITAVWKSPIDEKTSPALTIKHELYKTGFDGKKRHLGAITISSSQSVVNKHLTEAFIHTLTVELSILFFVGLIIWFLVRFLIVRPLSEFSSKVRDVAVTGFRNPIDIGPVRISEILTMQNGFNQLMQQISESHERIASQNAMLEQRVAERTREAMAKETRFRSIFERANAGITFFDASGTLLQFNDSYCNLVGYTPDEMKGINRSKFTHPDDFAIEKSIFDKMVSGLIDEYRIEKRYIRKDGEIIWGDAAIKAVFDESGRISNFVGVVVDITKRKLAEEEMIRAKHLAEAAARSKSEFLANMSHEIRTPMNGIIGITELVLKTQLSPRQHDYISKIKKAGRSLLGIINDILDFSKIEAGKMELDSAIFSIDTVMDTVSALIAEKAAEKGIELVISIDPEIPERLEGDQLRLGQILINIAGNAVKFTEKGKVNVIATLTEISGDHATLHFSVRDTGIGIRPEAIPYLFEPFTQADGSTTRRFGGTGLGLSISKRMVEAMGGTLEVESEPEKGSCFFFTIRFARPDISSLHLSDSLSIKGLNDSISDDVDFSSAMERLSGATILLVEDNLLNQEVATGILESVNIRVEVTANGNEAVDAVLEKNYDAVLMDIQMPVMDGIEATRIIRADDRFMNLPIIAMTANAMKGDRERCLENGMNDYISKPIDPGTLFKTLEKWICRNPEKTENPAPVTHAEPSAPQLSLPGIDVEDALRRMMGNRKLLISVLKGFRRDYPDAVENLKAFTEKRDLKKARQLTHTLKGITGNFSAHSLHQALIKLETALFEEKFEDLKSCIDSVESEMAFVMNGIGSLPEIEHHLPKSSKQTSTDSVQLEIILQDLAESLRSNEFRAVDLFSLLVENLPPETAGNPEARNLIADIERKIDGFIFHEAVDLLYELAGLIKIDMNRNP